MQDPKTNTQMRMDSNSLYREETFTDGRVGVIRKLTPVTPLGESDDSRPPIYQGQAQVMTPMGALPIDFQIPAATLADACDGFAEHAQHAVKDTMEEIEKMRREQASSLIVPGQNELPGGGLLRR